MDAALLAISSANDSTVLLEDVLDLLVDDVLVPEVELVSVEEVDALDEVVAVEEAACGLKVSFSLPKPSAAASLPLPETVTVSVSSLAVMTKLPLELIEAVTKALPEFMALIRSPTVSVPVDVYCVVLVPSLTLNVPPGRIPRARSDVFVVTGTVLVPVAGVTDALDEAVLVAAEVDDASVPLDDELVDVPFSTLCTRAEIWLLTRFKAVSLAMLDRPFDRSVSAVLMVLISESSAVDAWLWACASLQ